MFARLPSTEKSAPKTFYFGMDDALSNEPRNCVDQQMEQIQARLLQAREVNGSTECMLDYTDDVSNEVLFSVRFLPRRREWEKLFCLLLISET